MFLPFIVPSFLWQEVKFSPPTNAHNHPEETQTDLQSIVIETKDCATEETYNSPNSYRGVKTWETSGGVSEREAHLVPVQQAVIHRHRPRGSQKWAEVNRGHLAGSLLPHHCFSGLLCCSLWCQWNVQSAEFLMRSGQKYDASCPYSELISCFGLCRDLSSTFISF